MSLDIRHKDRRFWIERRQALNEFNMRQLYCDVQQTLTHITLHSPRLTHFDT